MGLFDSETPLQMIDAQLTDAPISVQLVSAAPVADDDSRVRVEVQITNNTDKKIDAYMLGFEFFTWFNEFHDHINGYSTSDVKPNKTTKMVWELFVGESNLVGSVVHFPFKVRFKDGEVWRAKVEDVERLVEDTFKTKIDIEQEDVRKRRK